MKCIILYATYSGNTALASDYIASELTKRNHIVDTFNLQEGNPSNVKQYDLVLLGSPTWGGGEPHDAFFQFTESQEFKTLHKKHIAIFGLGDSSFPNFCGAVDYLERYVRKIEGILITESLRIDNFSQEQGAMEKIEKWIATLTNKL